MPGKLRLRMDDLEIETFEAVAQGEAFGGTVNGNESGTGCFDCAQYTNDPLWDCVSEGGVCLDTSVVTCFGEGCTEVLTCRQPCW